MSRSSKGLIIRPGSGIIATFPVPPGSKTDNHPPPELPPGTVPFHLTPRPAGLAVDIQPGQYVQCRWSPRRRRWPEVAAFDDRVQQLEQRQAGQPKPSRLRETHTAAEAHEETSSQPGLRQSMASGRPRPRPPSPHRSRSWTPNARRSTRPSAPSSTRSSPTWRGTGTGWWPKQRRREPKRLRVSGRRSVRWPRSARRRSQP